MMIVRDYNRVSKATTGRGRMKEFLGEILKRSGIAIGIY
jgi:hypothetical protein